MPPFEVEVVAKENARATGLELLEEVQFDFSDTNAARLIFLASNLTMTVLREWPLPEMEFCAELAHAACDRADLVTELIINAHKAFKAKENN